MKKIILFTALLCAVVSYGQRRVAAHVAHLAGQGAEFRQFMPLEVKNAYPAKSVVNDATYATANLNAIQGIATSKPEHIELSIPYNNTLLAVQLYRVNVLAEGFHVDTDKATSVDFEKGAHYRGIIKNDPSSLASFNFFKGEMNGIISGAQYNNIVVGKLMQPDNEMDYIVYSDAKLNVLNNYKCSTTEPEAREFKQKNTNTTNDVNSLRCVTAYFEVDHDLFLAHDLDVVQTNNWMVSVFNNVQALFDNDGITTALKSVFIWTTPDPYIGENSSDYLFQFFELRPVFDGDVGQLVGIDEGGLGGVAIDLAGMCSDNNVSYSDVELEFESVPMFSWTVQVITHELGHLYGSPHTHGCHWNGNNTAIDGCGSTAGFIEGDCEIAPLPDPAVQGTIMSYCHLVPGIDINFANGFGPQPAARMLDHIESSMCLSTNCVNTCINTVTTITTTSSTTNSATIAWADDIGSGPWLVAVAPIDEAFTTWQGTFVNSFSFMGLDANTYYKFAVRPVCEDPAVTGVANELIFATPGNVCDGMLFTDTGGQFADYAIGEHMIRTLTPTVPGAKTFIMFTEFDIEQDFDFLTVYDGPDTNAPLLGVFTGNSIPGPFESTAPDGSLTFEFTSDLFVTAAGWEAMVTCANLATADDTFTNLTYYPNPAGNTVTIAAGEDINEIKIYNVSGQLLMNKEINTRETVVDISAYANGVYFFKVSSAGKEANFRIIKQ